MALGGEGAWLAPCVAGICTPKLMHRSAPAVCCRPSWQRSSSSGRAPAEPAAVRTQWMPSSEQQTLWRLFTDWPAQSVTCRGAAGNFFPLHAHFACFRSCISCSHMQASHTAEALLSVDSKAGQLPHCTSGLSTVAAGAIPARGGQGLAFRSVPALLPMRRLALLGAVSHCLQGGGEGRAGQSVVLTVMQGRWQQAAARKPAG